MLLIFFVTLYVIIKVNNLCYICLINPKHDLKYPIDGYYKNDI